MRVGYYSSARARVCRAKACAYTDLKVVERLRDAVCKVAPSFVAAALKSLCTKPIAPLAVASPTRPWSSSYGRSGGNTEMTITSMFSESVALSFTVTAASTATAPSATSGSQSCSTGSSCDDEDSARISPKAQALSKHSSDPSAKADDILEALDADEDGSVSKQEFSDNASQVMGELSRAGRHGRHHGLTLDKLFSRLDTNGDGAIDHDELGAAVDKASRSRDTSASTGTEAPAASLSFSATLVVSVTAIVQYSKASEEDTSPSSTGTQVNATA